MTGALYNTTVRQIIHKAAQLKGSNHKHLPKVDSLHTNRAVPHALKGALLLRAGFGALEAEALAGLPAKRRSGIAKSKASVIEESEAHTRRHGAGWICDDLV